MIVDNFEEMLAQSRAQPLVMGVALHPYIVGQPYRLPIAPRASPRRRARRYGLRRRCNLPRRRVTFVSCRSARNARPSGVRMVVTWPPCPSHSIDSTVAASLA
jgi:hypothetical protein